MSKVIEIGLGENCPKCNRQMIRRAHKERPKTEFFFTEWDYCKPCGHIQHYEKYKSNVWKQVEIFNKEEQQQISFLKQI